MECGNAQLGEIFNKNNFRRRSWDGHVQFRVVHGSSASDNCMRQEKSNNGNGNPIHLWTNRDVDNFDRRWNERSAAPCGHSAGSSFTRDCALRLCKGVWVASRYNEYRGNLRHVGFLAGNPHLLYISRPVRTRKG